MRDHHRAVGGDLGIEFQGAHTQFERSREGLGGALDMKPHAAAVCLEVEVTLSGTERTEDAE